MHLLTCLPLLFQSPTAPDLLAAIPEESFMLTYCADPVGFVERARQNDWVRLFASERGEPLLGDLGDLLEPATGRGLHRPLRVALELFGPTYYFHAPSLSGLVTQPPPTRDSLAEAMRAWLRGRGDAAEDASLRSVEIGAGRLEVGVSLDRCGAHVESDGPGADGSHPAAHYPSHESGRRLRVRARTRVRASS
jgi:hypothetical protein